MVGKIYRCFMYGELFDFIDYPLLLLLYGRIFGLHRNGIYAILSEGKHNNTYRYPINRYHGILYTKLWTAQQQAYSIRGRQQGLLPTTQLI